MSHQKTMALKRKLYHAISADEDGMAASFKLLDTDGDGVLSYAEFRKGMSDSLGSHLDEEQIEQLTIIFDTDKDGLIQYKEFLKEVKLLGKAIAKEKRAHAASFEAAAPAGRPAANALHRSRSSSWFIGLDGAEHSDEDDEGELEEGRPAGVREI